MISLLKLSIPVVFCASLLNAGSVTYSLSESWQVEGPFKAYANATVTVSDYITTNQEVDCNGSCGFIGGFEMSPTLYANGLNFYFLSPEKLDVMIMAGDKSNPGATFTEDSSVINNFNATSPGTYYADSGSTVFTISNSSDPVAPEPSTMPLISVGLMLVVLIHQLVSRGIIRSSSAHPNAEILPIVK